MNIELANPQTLQFTAECVKTAYHLSGYKVYNICTDAQHFVPYGVGDYVAGFIVGFTLITFALGLLAVFIGLFVMTLKT